MFTYLQSRIRGTANPGPGAPPPGLLAFYWHFVRQTKGWYLLMFATSLAVALIDTVIPSGARAHLDAHGSLIVKLAKAGAAESTKSNTQEKVTA